MWLKTILTTLCHPNKKKFFFLLITLHHPNTISKVLRLFSAEVFLITLHHSNITFKDFAIFSDK